MNSGLKFALLFQIAVTAGAQGVWERLADYPLEVFEVSATALDGKVYSVCGLTASGATNRMFVYDPRSDQWSEAAPAPLPNGGDHCNLATVGGRIYLLGALVRGQGGALADGGTYEYDAVTNTWVQVGQMPTARAASGVSAIGTKIYVMGGISGNTNYAANEVFDTETKQWSKLPDMPAARDHLASQVVRGRIYALGGRPGRGQSTTANDEFDPVTTTWRQRAAMPVRGDGMGSAEMQDRIILAGVGDGFRETLEYDALNDTWRTLAPMIAPRNGWYGNGAVIDGRLFLPAGGPDPGSSYSRTHDMFVYPPASAPVIRAVRNAASLQPAIAPATLVSLFGEALAGSQRLGSAAEPPVQLNGVSVTIGGISAPMHYVSAQQLNLLLPANLVPGRTVIRVRRAGVESATFDVEIAAAAPGIFSLNGTGTGPGAIAIAGTSLLAQNALPLGRAARAGELVQIYGTGFRRDAAVSLSIGGAPALIESVADLAEFAGVQLIAVRIPRDTPAGDAVTVVGESLGATSNAVTMAVSN